MQAQEKTMLPAELLEKLGVIAALVFEIGVEEEDDEICAFKDVIGIVGRARELPVEIVEKALADMTALIEAIRNAEPGKENEIIDDKGKWVRARDVHTEKQIIQALVDSCEWINEPDKRHRVDGLIHYLEDFWESPV